MKTDKIIAGMLKWLGFRQCFIPPLKFSISDKSPIMLETPKAWWRYLLLSIILFHSSNQTDIVDWPIQQLISMKALLMHFPQPAFSRGFCPIEAATSQSHHTRSVVPFTFTCTHKFCHQHYDTSCILPPIPLYILRSKIAKPPKKNQLLASIQLFPPWSPHNTTG